jgi:hypothetical protein
LLKTIFRFGESFPRQEFMKMMPSLAAICRGCGRCDQSVAEGKRQQQGSELIVVKIKIKKTQKNHKYI